MPLESPLTPPTDNLYKFMAIGGMVLAVFCFVYPMSQLRTEQERIMASMHDTALLKAKASAKGREADSYKAEREDLNADLKRDQADPIKIKEIEGNIRELLVKEDQATNEQTELLENSTADGEYILRQETAHLKFFWFEISLMYGSAFVGALMSFAGFHYWYVNVQTYQDFLLKKEAEEKGYILKPYVPPFQVVFSWRALPYVRWRSKATGQLEEPANREKVEK